MKIDINEGPYNGMDMDFQKHNDAMLKDFETRMSFPCFLLSNMLNQMYNKRCSIYNYNSKFHVSMFGEWFNSFSLNLQMWSIF